MACESCFSGFQWTPYNDGTGRCFRTVQTSWTFPNSPISLINRQSNVYTSQGTRIYSTFNTNGTAIGSVTTLTNSPLWHNGGSSSQGPMNRCAKWTSLTAGTTYQPTNTWVGFTTCIDVGGVAKTYYVGIAGDNDFRLTIDGVEIVNTYGGPYGGNTVAFNFWHVYPVYIGAGLHTVELFGLNRNGIAGFGCEIYDNTFSQLTAATTYGDLNVIFTSDSVISASTFQNLSGQYLSSGITCSQGGVVSPCTNGCLQYVICEPTTLSPSPTPTVTPTPTITPTPSLVQTSMYLSGCCDGNIYKSQSLTKYVLGETVRLSPTNFCYRVVQEPKIPPTTIINDSLGYQYVSGCLDKSCQPCPTTAFTFENSCKVLTILDFFYECNTTDPSSYNLSDGTLSVIVTGGTPPYTITWTDSNGNTFNGQTVSNAPSGTYHVQIVDYWGDFSGETDCVIVGPKDCDFNASIFEYIKPCYGCEGASYVLWNGLCVSPPLSGVSGTTILITTGDTSHYYTRVGTKFYEDVTNKPFPLTFKSDNIFVPATSGLTVQPGNQSLLVDATNFTPSPVATLLGTNDSNISGIPITQLVTITTQGIWREIYTPGPQLPPFYSLNNLRGIKNLSGLNQWKGITRCLEVPSTQQYHFVLAADDLFSLKINGEWFIRRLNNSTFNAGGFGTGGQPNRNLAADGVLDYSTPSILETYVAWQHCIPITLTAGTYFFEYFFSDVYGAPTSALFEVYSGVTTAQLTGFTTYSQISGYTAVSVRDVVDTNQLIIGNYGDDFGIYCEPDAILNGLCDGTPYCEKTTIKIPCDAVPSPTPTPTPTPTPSGIPEPCNCYFVRNWGELVLVGPKQFDVVYYPTTFTYLDCNVDPPVTVGPITLSGSSTGFCTTQSGFIITQNASHLDIFITQGCDGICADPNPGGGGGGGGSQCEEGQLTLTNDLNNGVLEGTPFNSQQWYFTGPAGPNESNTGSHAGYIGSFPTEVTGNVTGCLRLYVNGGPVASVQVNGAGIYYMTATINLSDCVEIVLQSVC